MARTLKGKNATAKGGNGKPAAGTINDETRKHNVKARAAQIRSISKRVIALKSERKRIGEEISEIMHKEVKGDLGMKITDFNSGLRVYELEGEQRAEYVDTIHEMFDALAVGGTVDMVDALERSIPPAIAKTDETKPADAATH